MRAARCWRPAAVAFLMAMSGPAAAQTSEPRIASFGLEEGRAPSPEAVGELKRRAAALRRPPSVAPRVAPAAAMVVNCGKGKSLQAAVDAAERGASIEVRGLCHENVRIEGKAITLSGTDPDVDGIRGVAPPAGVVVDGVLTILYSDGVRLENLSIEDGAQAGVQIFYSQVTMEGCRVSSNAAGGLRASAGSFLAANGVVLEDNGANGLLARRGSSVFCMACELSGNTGFAAHANQGGVLSLLDSTVVGTNGIVAQVGAYADVDCLTEETAHPCSLAVSANAAIAFDRSVAALLGVEDFVGSLNPQDDSRVSVFESTQLGTGLSGTGQPRSNLVGDFSTLWVEASRLRGDTGLFDFARALLVGATVDGTVTCHDAADAYARDGLTLTPGSAVNGCEHVP